MEHHFNVGIAKEYGINVAVFLNNVAYWIQKNQANNRHFHNDRYWTYNTSEALTILFPYWSTDQMDRLIKKCVSLKLLLIDNFNQNQYDRTRWYGLTDLALELYELTIPRNRGMDPAESRNGFSETAEPIPDNKPDKKPNKKQESYKAPDSKKRHPVKKPKKRSLVLTNYPKDFYPDDKRRTLLTHAATRTNTTEYELLEKFETVSIKYKTKAKDWQATFEEFLTRELPKKVYETDKGTRKRYDNRSLHE